MNAHHGAEIHNAAVFLPEHDAAGRFHAKKRALQIRVNHRIEVFLFHHHHEAVPGDAGVVHQNMNVAELLHGGIHQRLDRLAVRHVSLHGANLRTHALQLLHRLLCGGGVPGIGKDDVRAALRQLTAHSPAQSPASPGDHGGLSDKIHSHFTSFSSSGSFSTSSAVSTAKTGKSGSVFFTKPLNALPGPISTMASTPSAAMARMQSSM
ncbi:hypothetical protein SDC9_79558 [bioreactor metagenome]|uniref:Uncharacterized protein n=1 Tax=bioreactor metagenome TaxID=1076179 RepID=A0A644YYS6_9ZZZZ